MDSYYILNDGTSSHGTLLDGQPLQRSPFKRGLGPNYVRCIWPTGIFTYISFIFDGFHVGKYTISPMDASWVGVDYFRVPTPIPQGAPTIFPIKRHDYRQATTALNWTEGDVEAAHAAQVDQRGKFEKTLMSQVTNGIRGFFYSDNKLKVKCTKISKAEKNEAKTFRMNW